MRESEGEWSRDNALLAHADIGERFVTIHDIRNTSYRSVHDYDLHYYDKTFDLDAIESLWYMLEPLKWSGFGLAHTLLSFGFAGGEYVAISAEIRKKPGEAFSVLKSLVHPYRLVYIIADERDVMGLRANYRHNEIYLYPVKMERADIRALFVTMLRRANALAEEPEDYHVAKNSCALSIMKNINQVVPGKVPWSPRALLPAYSVPLLEKVGLLDASLPLRELRAKYRITDRVHEFANDPHFFERIRGL